MRAVELVLILLAVAAALHLLAERFGIPRPALLVLGGLLLAVTPRLPVVELPPEMVFLIFVPSLIYVAAFDTSYRDFGKREPEGVSGSLPVRRAAQCRWTWPSRFVFHRDLPYRIRRSRCSCCD
jgi:hypothetical protein